MMDRYDEDEDDLDYVALIKAITRAKEKVGSNHPPNLVVGAMPTDICFHPDEDIIAVSTYNGNIELYGYSEEENKLIIGTQLENDVTCREMCFDQDGENFYAALSNSDIIIYDVETMKPRRTLEGFTESPVNSFTEVDEHRLAAGTDDGFVHIWDKRSPEKTVSLDVCEGEITSLLCDEEGKTLVCSCADGIIAAIKVRANKIQVKSEEYKTEFNCLATLRQNTKLAVGDSNGDVYFFNWGEFGYHTDMTPLHSDCINDFVPITERIGITCCGDGKLYATHFYPKKLLGIVGEHKHSVEKIDVCNDGHLIASSSLDETIKFWNVKYFEDFTIPLCKEAKKKEKAEDKKKVEKHKLPSSSQENSSEFFKGLE